MNDEFSLFCIHSIIYNRVAEIIERISNFFNKLALNALNYHDRS